MLNDTYIGSFSVMLFLVKNANSVLEVGSACYQVKPKVIKPIALGPLH
jgi:hypothetical protein